MSETHPDQIVVKLSTEAGVLVREALRLEILRYERQGSERQAKLLSAARDQFPASENEASEGLTQEMPQVGGLPRDQPLERIADTFEVLASVITNHLEGPKKGRNAN